MSNFTPILVNTNFVNEFALSLNTYSEDMIDEYIVSMQRKLLTDLLGMDLYLKFGAQLPTPTKAKFTDLLNGVVYVDPKIGTYTQPLDGDSDINVDYIGLNRMLKIFTYLEIIKKKSLFDTIIGLTKGSSQNGESPTLDGLSMISDVYYNEAVKLYCSAQKFITDMNNQDTTSTAFTDNGNGTWTALVPSTKYLSVGDTIHIGTTDYTVTAVSSNASITFTKASGGSMTASQSIAWSAFPTYAGRKKKIQMAGGNF